MQYPKPTAAAHKLSSFALDIINIDLSVLAELESALLVFRPEVVGFVDFSGFRQFAVRLQIPRFVRRVLDDHVGLVVLEVTERKEDDVALVDPHLTGGSVKGRESHRK